jgi:hypothetical protein
VNTIPGALVRLRHNLERYRPLETSDLTSEEHELTVS